MSTPNTTPTPADTRAPHLKTSEEHRSLTPQRLRLSAALRCACSAMVFGVGVLKIIGASAIGLNDWADTHATSTSMHAAASQPLNQ